MPRQQEQQQQQEADTGTAAVAASRSMSTYTGQTIVVQDLYCRAEGYEPAPVSLEQALRLSHLAAPRRRRTRNAAVSTEPSSDSDSGSAHAVTPEMQSSGVCKYFVNTGKCPRGALCPHVHDASLQDQWLTDR